MYIVYPFVFLLGLFLKPGGGNIVSGFSILNNYTLFQTLKDVILICLIALNSVERLNGTNFTPFDNSVKVVKLLLHGITLSQVHCKCHKEIFQLTAVQNKDANEVTYIQSRISKRS